MAWVKIRFHNGVREVTQPSRSWGLRNTNMAHTAEPRPVTINKMAGVPSEYSDQPGHPPEPDQRSLCT